MIRNLYLSVCQAAIFCLKFKLKYRIAHNKPFPAPLVKKRLSERLTFPQKEKNVSAN